MKLFIKGIIIGIGKILPGISGSVLAISLNEYKNIINSLNNLCNKNNLKYLIKIFLGMLLSIIIISKILYMYINKYNFYMFSLFIGLIIGTIPSLAKTINKRNILFSIIGFVILALINKIKIVFNIPIWIKGTIIGIIESISTIIPGISGTALLTNFSLYEDYLYMWSIIYKIKLVLSNLLYFVPFLIALIITSIIAIRLLYLGINKYENQLNGLIFGFVLASIYLLSFKLDFTLLTPLKIFFFFLFIVLGFIIGFILDNLVNKK